ncbi:MAG: type IV toxin-antitoxin system AbiEi family antitoxin domain-containing protein [Solirubrobacterales bacterium]|nr:type IV toxin-antitoxin system AbiEi family antitoxin domain-containing protein [Solirubrobacterales bacterium]MBV9165266.1 type IV toxin-antitoxin system AbiEi family antitoxin domain-containing protein [Solirubrobacterales bacterium]
MAASTLRVTGSKLTNVNAVGERPREGVTGGDYVADIVSAGELRHILCVRRGVEDFDDQAIAWIAGRQLGIVTSWQLQALGRSRSAIARRVRGGALHRIHPGVFLVGHAVEVPGARKLAGVLACGEGAVVSHRSAAILWGLTAGASAEVEVSVVARNCRPRPGLRVHRLSRLDGRDSAAKDGIPVTSPARALVDLAASAPPEELERAAVAEARARRLVTERQLSDALDRAGNRAGVAALRAIIQHQGGPRLTRSEAERRLLRLIRAARLPEPALEFACPRVRSRLPMARSAIDRRGRWLRLPRTSRAFERDRRRDMSLRDAGYEVIRVTWRQIVDEPLLVIAHIARAFERARSAYNSSASSP